MRDTELQQHLKAYAAKYQDNRPLRETLEAAEAEIARLRRKFKDVVILNGQLQQQLGDRAVKLVPFSERPLSPSKRNLHRDGWQDWHEYMRELTPPESPRDRLMWDAYIAGETYQQVAERIGVSAGRCAQRMSKCIRAAERAARRAKFNQSPIVNEMRERFEKGAAEYLNREFLAKAKQEDKP